MNRGHDLETTEAGLRHLTTLLRRSRRMSGRVAFVLLLAGCLGLISCAGHHHTGSQESGSTGIAPVMWPATDHSSSTRDHCEMPGGPVLPGGALTVVVRDSVDAGHAPIPTNAGEKLVFTQLYETLVRVDCAGHLLPNLASGWTCTSDSTTWIFSLRENARFWDGKPVTPMAVLASWCRAQDSGGCQDPWTWLDAHASTLKALDNRRLSISLPEPQAALPLMLAHSAMAVAVRRPGWTWPVGSGPARLSADTLQPMPALRCIPNRHHPRAPRWQSLTFQCLAGQDARDLVATDFDLLETDIARDAAFFAQVPGFEVHPLPWNRTYLLLCPPEQNPPGTVPWMDGSWSSGLAQAMTSVAWQPWASLVIPGPGRQGCPQVHGPVSALTAAPLAWHLAELELDQNTLVYPATDPGTGDLAAFLAARMPQPIRLVPLQPRPLEFVLQWQMAGAGIMTVDQEYPTGCLQLSALLGKVGWLQTILSPTPSFADDSLAEAQQKARSPQAGPVSSLLRSGHAWSLGASHGWLVMRHDLGGLKLGFDAVPWLETWGRLSDTPTIPDDEP